MFTRTQSYVTCGWVGGTAGLYLMVLVEGYLTDI